MDPIPVEDTEFFFVSRLQPVREDAFFDIFYFMEKCLPLQTSTLVTRLSFCLSFIFVFYLVVHSVRLGRIQLPTQANFSMIVRICDYVSDVGLKILFILSA